MTLDALRRDAPPREDAGEGGERGDASSSLAPPAPLDLARSALFADLDGTLAPIAATPEAVGPDADRRRLLGRLSAALGGRLAVISGRGLADLDRLLEGRVPAIAAVHGLVRRTARGQTLAVPPPPALAEAAEKFAAFADRHPGILIENKGLAVALHYRAAPSSGEAARALADDLGRELRLLVQHGREVVEMRGPGPDKGEAVCAFMAEAPFAGHAPVFLGDDLTDEAGFRAVARLGGQAVIVGERRPTAAAFALPDVAAVHRWLASALEARGR